MSHSTLDVLEPTLESFGLWLQTPDFRAPLATVLHHTFSPTAAQYKGRQTMVAIRAYHMNERGWSDIGANAYACPDGHVVTGRPLSEGNWSHALVTRYDPKKHVYPEAEAYAICKSGKGINKQWFNFHAFGLETVANFDSEVPWGAFAPALSFEAAMRALTVVHRLFNIPPNMLFFHRDVADKSCPGLLLDRATVRADLAQRLGQEWSAVKVVLGGQVVACQPQMVGDYMTVAAVPFLTAMALDPQSAAEVIHENGRAFVGQLRPYCTGWSLDYRDMEQGPRLYLNRKA